MQGLLGKVASVYYAPRGCDIYNKVSYACTVRGKQFRRKLAGRDKGFFLKRELAGWRVFNPDRARARQTWWKEAGQELKTSCS